MLEKKNALQIFTHNLSYIPTPLSYPPVVPEMSVRMSNLDNDRDERDDDSHEDRGISKLCWRYHVTVMSVLTMRM